MAELFTCGAPATEAILLAKGACQIVLANTEPFTVEIEDSLVGAEPLILQRSGNSPGLHLYGISADEALIKQRVGLTEIEDALRTFEQGFTQNRFSSQVLAQATESLVNLRQTLSSAESAYETKALAFALLILELKRFASSEKFSEVLSVIDLAASTPLFELGVALRRERVFASVKVVPSRLTRAAERVRASSVLCHEDEEARSMYVLLEGRIAVTQRGRLVAHIDQPGEAFGEMALFLEGRRTATLIAETDSAVFQLYERDMPEFHSSHPDVFINIGATLAARLVETLRHLAHIMDSSAGTLATYSPEAIAAGERGYSELWDNLHRLRSKIAHPKFLNILESATPPTK